MAKRMLTPEYIGRINAGLARHIEADLLRRCEMMKRVLEAWSETDVVSGQDKGRNHQIT